MAFQAMPERPLKRRNAVEEVICLTITNANSLPLLKKD